MNLDDLEPARPEKGRRFQIYSHARVHGGKQSKYKERTTH